MENLEWKYTRWHWAELPNVWLEMGKDEGQGCKSLYVSFFFMRMNLPMNEDEITHFSPCLQKDKVPSPNLS